MNIKTHLSLENLENEFWGDPKFDSNLVIKCYELRKKPIRDFTIEDLRLMIGQGISLNYLIPLAINKLENNILAEGSLFEGDLLNNVLDKKTKEYWKNNDTDWNKLNLLIKKNQHELSERFNESIEKKIQILEAK